jgi:hypothetical protein
MNHTLRLYPAVGPLVFFIIAVSGLLYVKWWPYYHRSFVAAATHSIGGSILTGGAARPPEPSLSAALDYELSYGKAIWKAMVLGLLPGSAVQALLPGAWVRKVLGGNGLGAAVAGGILAIPGMMISGTAHLRRERRATIMERTDPSRQGHNSDIM